jgi:O-antigen/teichoic acid export membrane protein
VPLLDWFTWAIFCNLVGWPLGFWLVARRSKRVVAIFQILLSIAGLLLAVLLVPAWGVKGAAMAFFGGALVYVLVLLGMTRWISGAWMSFRSALWVASKASTTILGVVVTASTTLACIIIYLRVMKAKKGIS